MLTTTLALATLSLASPAPPATGADGVAWYEGPHVNAVGEARARKVPLLTYFWANTENCARLYNETMSDEGVVREMSELICFSANAGDAAGRALLERYGLETVPAILITVDGAPEEMLLGFMDPATFVGEIQRIKRGENTISDLRARIAGEHQDLQSELEERQMLAVKLGNVGAREEAEAMHHSILERDPKATTVLGAQAQVERVLNEIHEKGGDDLAGWDFKPLEKLVRKIKSPVGKFEARVTLASYECEAGRSVEGIATFMAAWKARPQEETAILDSGFGIVERVCGYGDELTNKQKGFALQVARDLVALAELRRSKPCEGCAPEDGGEVALVADSEGEETGAEAGCGCREDDGVRPYAQFQVARCQALNGAREEAIATMRAVLEQDPENETYVAYLKSLGEEES